MANAVETRPMTAEEFLELDSAAPDGIFLELIRGEVRECDVTARGPRHSIVVAHSGHLLLNWLDDHPERVGEVSGADVLCRIESNPDTIIGLDAAYFEGDKFLDLPVNARFRADAEPRLYSDGEILSGEPELPGFSCPVARLFGRVRTTNQ